MPRYKPDSIATVGLPEWVNRGKTQQNGHGYDFLVECINKGINKSDIARLFNRDRLTIVSWCAVYDASKER